MSVSKVLSSREIKPVENKEVVLTLYVDNFLNSIAISSSDPAIKNMMTISCGKTDMSSMIEVLKQVSAMTGATTKTIFL